MDFESWKNVHQQQLNEIPELYWESLFTKLCTESFDAGENFIMTPSSSGWRVRVCKPEGIPMDDSNSVFLADHSWTYLPENCYQQLCSIPGLARRMANLMDLIQRPATPPAALSHDTGSPDRRVNGSESSDVNGIDGEGSSSEEESEGGGESPLEDVETERNTSANEEEFPPSPPSEELVLRVMEEMWRFNDCYSVSNVPVPVWYILEEFGSRIPHSTNPTIAIKPFFHILTQMSHSVFWPLRDLDYGDDITRNRIPRLARTELEKACYAIPWSPPDHLPLSHDLWAECDSIAPPPIQLREGETLPLVQSSRSPVPAFPYKVFTDIDLIKKSLKHPHFVLVSSSVEADILWLLDTFKDFAALPPNCFINQFPSENVLTCKDLLAFVSKANAGGTTPRWLPETYNLFYELPLFVHRYKSLEESNSDNTWIVKAWNLGRGMDLHITQNLVKIIRLVNTIPKVACKYITDPVLFHREEIGKVKMDIRYVVMLVSVKPLVVYAYDIFWLRFANKPFSLDSFHDYQKHFTVMNYRDEADLKHIESVDFIPLWNQQYPMHQWEGVEKEIFKAIRELFQASTAKPPPAGIREFLQSRAMYAIDLMLEWSQDEGCDCRIMQPKLLEVNFSPDTIRACKHHPYFYNHIFECLFLPESLHSDDLPVTKL